MIPPLVIQPLATVVNGRVRLHVSCPLGGGPCVGDIALTGDSRRAARPRGRRAGRSLSLFPGQAFESFQGLTVESARRGRRIKRRPKPRRRVRMGAASFAIAPGGSATVDVRLNRRGRRLVRRALVVRARVTATALDGRQASTGVTIKATRRGRKVRR
ncbi:MAG: hypothetical protein WKF31_00435 [Thermoleophilaceae bacterium]